MSDKNQGKLEGVMSKGYGIIPKLIMKDKDLSIESKAIYAYLSSYTGSGDTAYPSISLMCSDLGISKDRFYRHRTKLIDKDYIRVEQHQNKEGWKNNVYTIVSLPFPQNTDTLNKDTQNTDTQNNDTNKNSTNNNSINNNNSNKDRTVIPYKKIIDYLNTKANKRFSVTNKYKGMINARIKEGYTEDDFYTVIDKKILDWHEGLIFGNGKPATNYLKPSTLFSEKFGDYLNEEVANEQNGNSSMKDILNDVWEG